MGHRGPLAAAAAPRPPDGGWGWVVVAASFMIHVLADGFTYSFGVYYNEMLRYFREGKGATSWVASILVGVTLSSGPLSSALVNKYGCRAVTIGGAVLASFSISISAFAESIVVLYFTIGLLTGLGLGLIYLPAIVSVTCYFEKYRSLATGIAVCGSGIGTFLMAPFTEWLVTEFSWKGGLFITGALMFNNIVFGILFRPLPDEPLPPSEEKIEVKPVSNGHSRGNDLELDKPPRRPHSVHGHAGVIPANGAASDLTWVSQPALAMERRSSKHASGIMYRKDVLYSGSVANLTKSAPWLPVSTGDEKKVAASSDEEGVICGCIHCPKETSDTLNEMLDVNLFKDPIFVLFTISNFCTSIGFNVPYLFIVPQADLRGLTTLEASYLVSIIGIANTVGRIILGYISDKPWVNRLNVYIVCLTICGISTALSAYCDSFISFAFYAAVFGFTIGAYVGLTSVILVDLLGLDRLTNAFGLLLLFQGIASFIGPPITGWLYDAFKSYNPGFIVSGITIAISGLMLFMIPPLQRWLEKKERQTISPS